jgi:ATP-dependent exoDNAse (exonuclease V) alpha subunit
MSNLSASSSSPPDKEIVQDFINDHADALLTYLTNNKSFFSHLDVDDALLQPSFLPQAPTSAIRDSITDQLLQDRSRVQHCQVNNETAFTSVALMKTEQALLRTAQQWANNDEGGCDLKHLESAIANHAAKRAAKGKDPKPMDDMVVAAESMLAPGRLKVLIGPPGAGKTTIIRLIADSLNKADQSIIVSAQSGMLCQKLSEETGQVAVPLGDLMVRLSGLQNERFKQEIGLKPGSTLILDEAAMLGTRQMADVFQMAQDHDLRLMMVGDVRQIQAATAGSPLRKILEQVKPAQLQNVTRQKDPVDAQATLDLYHGNAESALESYENRDLLIFCKNGQKLRNRVVTDFVDWQERHQ